MRRIDIPDPVNPPSGCRFHTRCPEAREVCREETPPVYESGEQRVMCFREDPDHEYWNSTELAELEGEADVGIDDGEPDDGEGAQAD